MDDQSKSAYVKTHWFVAARQFSSNDRVKASMDVQFHHVTFRIYDTKFNNLDESMGRHDTHDRQYAI